MTFIDVRANLGAACEMIDRQLPNRSLCAIFDSAYPEVSLA